MVTSYESLCSIKSLFLLYAYPGSLSFVRNRMPAAKRNTATRPEKTVEVDSVGVEYLRRMIEECQNRNIEVMLTYLPFPASEEDWDCSETQRQMQSPPPFVR